MLTVDGSHGLGPTHGESFLAATLVASSRALTWLLAASAFVYVAMSAANAEEIEIRTSSGRHLLTVEVALTRAEKERGLMFRKTLAEDHGMLFYFRRVRPISIWMKNTYIPLDIVFIAEDGRIVRIERDSTPRSLRLIPSKHAVRAVLEVPAGTSRKLGIDAGDTVTLPRNIP